MRGRRVAAVAVAMMMLAGCGGGDDGAAAEGVDQTNAPPAQADDATTGAGDDPAATEGAVTVATADSELGDILVDGEGNTLYVFDDDTGETSTCTGDCAANWPALTGEATAVEGADDSLLGTSQRDDGTSQVTYAGHPVYHFAGDQAPGDTNGQAVGDKWWVIAPDGEAITTSAARADDSGGY